MPLGLWGKLVVAIAAWLPAAGGDLVYEAFTKDPFGLASHLRLLGGAQVNYYSTEFNELCEEVGASPLDPALGMTQRFQTAQLRVDPYYVDLPEHIYLDDDYLDNPNAGKVSQMNYTEVNVTKAFVPDGQLHPLPHHRTQLCHYALRLTQPQRSQNAAAWSRYKQLVAYGFETQFHFRVLHRNQECTAGAQTSDRASLWCKEGGADGFAFVVQNGGRKEVGTEVSGMGYGFAKCLAVEFDMFWNSGLGDLNGNHISVHVPEYTTRSNSAAHSTNSIAYTDDIPPLQEGTHHVRITYSTQAVAWDQLGRDYESGMDSAGRVAHFSGRAGLLTVELDGRRVIVVPVDLARAAQVDTSSTAQEDPDPTAYDELGSGPGKAWVGFTSSTTYFHFQSVDILSWTFKEEPPCPHDNAEGVLCRVDGGTIGRSACVADGTALCSLVVRNIARQPILLSARMVGDKPYHSTPCGHGILEWNPLHQYFLGCPRTVYYTSGLEELVISTLDGLRSGSVNDTHILQIAPVPFRRRSVSEWCVKEHKYDPARLNFALCSCEFCIRLLDLSSYYAVFYQHLSAERYGLLCPCFEAAEVSHNSASWETLEPLLHMRIHVSRGCSYTSQCSLMLKFVSCEPTFQTYQLGNPMTPTLYSNGFENLSLDNGLVQDGKLRGDACDCEPKVKPYIGDDEGNAGMCADAALLQQGTYNTLAECVILCQEEELCKFLTYWMDVGECRTYWYCLWETCTSDYCYAAATYSLEQLSVYFNTKHEVQYFNVFPLDTLQTTAEECQACLHLYEEVHCNAQCGQAKPVPYSHWPAGGLCATCMFAGNRMHELTAAETTSVKACAYAAIREGQDPWEVCNSTALEAVNMPTIDLFNGVSTHFLSECPGREFEHFGAVCVPNLHAIPHFPLQVLSRMAAINDTVWTNELQCLNAVCDLLPRSGCYFRLATWDFRLSLHAEEQNIGNSTAVNGAGISELGLVLNKSFEQYLVTEPLPVPLENYTIEAWVTLADEERITNIARGKPIMADTKWRDSYLPALALDGDLETYWSSQVGPAGNPLMDAVFIIDLSFPVNAESVTIYWLHHATDFSILVSADNATWEEIASSSGNSELTTRFDVFFAAQYVQLSMTRAGSVRGAGPDEGRPVYSIREIDVALDSTISRLKPTVEVHYWNRTAFLAVDGDENTYWAAEIGVQQADLLVDLGETVTANVTRINVRYVPESITLYVGETACDGGMPSTELATLTSSQIVGTAGQVAIPWIGRCVGATIVAGTVYNEYLATVTEVEIFQEKENLAVAAVVLETSPSEASHITSVLGALDGDPSTYWLLEPMSEQVSLTIDLGAEQNVMSIDLRWATVNGSAYKAVTYSMSAGLSLDSLAQIDVVNNYYQMGRSVIVLQVIRYFRLSVTDLWHLNPNGNLALEDILIYNTSSNLASGATANASSEWRACDTCSLNMSGSTRLHKAGAAIDGTLTTWWGPQLGVSATGTMSLEVIFPQLVGIDVAAIWWKYPTNIVAVYCSTATAAGGPYFQIGADSTNTKYRTTIPFTSQYTCGGVKLYTAIPLDTVGGEDVIGIQEFAVYSTTTDNHALNQLIYASDGSSASAADAVDAEHATKWDSESSSPTNLTLDLGGSRSFWGVRLLFPSNLVPQALSIALAEENGTFTTVETVTGNTNRNVYAIGIFTARYILVSFEQTSHEIFSVRTLGVYGSANLAIGNTIISDSEWLHSGYEAVDGVDTTYWMSEPLCNSAILQLDLNIVTFVAGGVTIEWKYPAQAFSLWTSVDKVDWHILYANGSNTDTLTDIRTEFEARYLEIRMYKPYYSGGDPIYGIYSFELFFDTNLAHSKHLTATHEINTAQFGEESAIDGDFLTVWMPQQDAENTSITFDLLDNISISGFEIYWRRPPLIYRVDYQDADTGTWLTANKWEGLDQSLEADYQQSWLVGFRARRLCVHIEEAVDSDEGKIVALREVLLYVVDPGNNIAKGRPMNSSDGPDGGEQGKPPHSATDGFIRETYWHAGETVSQAWIEVILDELPPTSSGEVDGHNVAEVLIYWRFPPNVYFQVELFYNTDWLVVHSESYSEALVSSVLLLRKANRVKVSIEANNTYIGIKELIVYLATDMNPPAVERAENPWIAPPDYMIDLSNQTYYMVPSDVRDVHVELDLGRLYWVQDIDVWFGFKAFPFNLYVSQDNSWWVKRQMTSSGIFGFTHLEDTSTPVNMRYLRIEIVRGHLDADENRWGTSIRDIRVWLYTNLAVQQPATSDSVWDYSPQLAVDEDETTYWFSQFGAQHATFLVDLGAEYNIGGAAVTFGYIAGDWKLSYSKNTSNFTLAASEGLQTAAYVEMPSTVHFQARYLKLELSNPYLMIEDPDLPGSEKDMNWIFSIYEFQVWEHTGGGGILGVQSLNGMEYNSLIYGLSEPGKWLVGSEADIITQDFIGSSYHPTGEPVHIAATFQTLQIRTDNDYRQSRVTFFQNGIPVGTSYTKWAPAGRLSQENQTRIVFGVRSSAHDANSTGGNGADPRVGVKHGSTHSPYISATIHNASLIRNALSNAEVYGLYERAQGKAELGCHCYDACPTGSNRFFPGVPVPCSGHGACLRSPGYSSTTYSGIPPGYCVCSPGYSGEACETHCSELSEHGCCKVDDDCPVQYRCDQATRACVDCPWCLA